MTHPRCDCHECTQARYYGSPQGRAVINPRPFAPCHICGRSMIGVTHGAGKPMTYYCPNEVEHPPQSRVVRDGASTWLLTDV